MAQVRKKKKKSRLVLILLGELLLILILFGGFYIYNKMNKIKFDNSQDSNIQQNEEVEKKEGYRNIVLFGVDSRENYLEKSTHSDTIVIASINNETKDVKLASVYRDTYVNIPDEGYNKINGAYFKGGYSLALSTINKNFDLDIHEYVTVNFQAVVNAIDTIGGIELDVTKEELKYLNGYVRELNRINGTNVPGLKSAGTQTVNGTQATAYARIRYTAGGDYKRTERQRVVIEKVFDKVKHSDLGTINDFIDEVFPQIYTNLKNTELIDLANDVLSYDIVDQTGFPFEKDAHTYNKVSYVFPIDLADNVTRLHEFLFNETGYTPSSTVREYSDYVEGIREQ
jgi:polyisoprenyl-teichoic acid--peptidoglycan teichoic acid transferase